MQLAVTEPLRGLWPKRGIRWMPRALLRGYQEDAPDNLRSFVLQPTNDLGLTPEPPGLPCARFSIVIGSFILHGKQRPSKKQSRGGNEEALCIREKVFGPELPDPAESLNNLALLYWAI